MNREPWPQPIHYPDALPITPRVDEIAAAITRHQVIILAGETGSGKTTQLPKICLSLGYGEIGQIAHTQPRRIAARTVADRIAIELSTPLGDGVGYQVRFTDKSTDNTRIKLMTDGVLLAEFQQDRLLKKYDVIIIDEAHERSLNIDFLLGLLKTLCQKRPELRVIVTSATIDLQKFSNHFTLSGKPAPILEVSGRTYPVETIYHAPVDDKQPLPDLIADTVSQLIRDEAQGHYQTAGDVLVFCAGERDIRDAAASLRQAKLPIEVLPLYSRLSIAEQNKVFRSTQQRKVVLATNVAETSITVPGIGYVIDPGLARISRYNFRSKIQRLPIEPISQASANQRRGRSGRMANGVCIRLYEEQSFSQRPAFTSAEILRSNLASVILKMVSLGVRDISQFEFIDRPDDRLLKDGFKLLEELGALNKGALNKGASANAHKLTKIGRQMSNLSIDPKFARILIEANTLGCLRDALVVISALSIQDPRERPAEKQQSADQTHQRLNHQQSDFFSHLHLWQAINNARDKLSNSQFKQLCLQNYWSIARIFEWRELFRQLVSQSKSLGFKLEPWQIIELPNHEKKKRPEKAGFSPRYESLHRALLAGLMSNVASRDHDNNYLATRSRTITLFPGSAQSKCKPKWIVAGEYLETSRLFAHNVGAIKPDWVADCAQHLCHFSYSAPHYHKRSGSVKAFRKTVLYGLTLREKELINYAPINSTESRQSFIQQAMVEGQYQPRHSCAEFVKHNQSLISNIEKLETKTRRRNLLIDDDAIYRFYAERLPNSVVNRHSLEAWLVAGNQDTLKLSETDLLQTGVTTSHVTQFPDQITIQGKTIRLIYKFDPGKHSDGVTMIIPVSVLAPFPDHVGDWLVPGLLREKCIALMRTLPKPIRRNFAPVAAAVDRIFEQLQPNQKRLQDALADQLFTAQGVKVSGDDFQPKKLDSFYHMHYRVIDIDGSLIEESRDLTKLKTSYANAVKSSIHADNAPDRVQFERHDIRSWDFGNLAPIAEYQHQGMTVRASPMLMIQPTGSISLLLHDQPLVAAHHTRYAIIALAKQVLGENTHRQSLRYLQKELMVVKSHNSSRGLSALAQQLDRSPLASALALSWKEKLIDISLAHCCFSNQLNEFRDQAQFEKALKQGARHWVKTATELESALLKSLALNESVLVSLDKINAQSLSADSTIEEIKAHSYRLFEPSFLSYTPLETLKQYPRYLRAIECRIEKLVTNASNRFVNEVNALNSLQGQFNNKVNQLARPEFELDYVFLSYPKLAKFRVMLEEWRVSVFAQQLRTRIPVSQKRLENYWQQEID